ncbi:MAG: hypothetical protein ACIARR_12235 [Phycisphaerales bacterium JB059]
MTRFNHTTMLAMLAGALAAPALAQPFETAIGGPIEVDDVLDDTIYVDAIPGALPDGPLSAGWIRGEATAGADDMYLVRQDATGAFLWDTLLFSPGREQGNEVVNNSDFGFALVGETDAGAAAGIPGLGISLTILDAFGSQLFSRLYLGTPFIGDTQGGADVYANADGGYAISGRAAMPDVPVFQAPVAIRTDFFGAPLWSNYYFDALIGTESFGSFADIHEFFTPTGEVNYIATGYMSSDFTGDPASRDTLVVRLDATGAVVWSNLYRFPYGEEGLGIEITENQQIVIVGLDHNPDIDSSFMMRLDLGGGLIWYNRYFGHEAVDGSVREVGGARLATVGVAHDFTGAVEARLMQTGAGGVPFANFAYGGERDEAGDAIDLSPDGFVIGAHTNSFAFGLEDFYVLSPDAAGKTGCEKEREVGFEPAEPQVVQIPLRAQERLENITWQWNQNRPEHPIAEVCDPNPCPTCACDFAPPLGVCDFSDVVAFLASFGAGCP